MNAIVTIAIGSAHQRIFRVTRPTIESYATRTGSDLVVIDQVKESTTTPHYEKLQLGRLLTKYRRIVYLDADLIVRDDCPDLFKVVPEDHVGLFNEAPYVEDDLGLTMREASKVFRIPLKDWDGDYYNTGVMIISRMHRDLFTKPVTQNIYHHFEQSYLNLRIQQTHTRVHRLDYRYNRIKALDRHLGEHRLNSYIIHYAGILYNTHLIAAHDLERWSAGIRNVPLKATYAIGARLGDVIEAEPVIRHLIGLHPGHETTIVTSEPDVFAHLQDRTRILTFDEYSPGPDEAMLTVDLMTKDDDRARKYMSPDRMHVVDWYALRATRGTIPDEHKRIGMKVTAEGLADAMTTASDQGCDLKETVLVHPGRGWPSKTFPAEWWQQVLDGLSRKVRTAVIGRTVKEEYAESGTVELKLPDGTGDLRDRLDLPGLNAALSLAPVLLTNDSAPMHAAGAFDNWIVLIPTCKHPDHVLPWRTSNHRHRTTVLTGKPMWPLITRLSEVPEGHSISEFLPEPDKVVEETLRAYETMKCARP